MYTMIRNSSIYAQATGRQDAVKRLKSNAETLAIHMAKCIVYGDSLHCLKHWLCEEICDWIKLAAIIKPKGGRFKASMYHDTIFGYLGDERSDAVANLLDLQIRVRHGEYDYPDFDITEKMKDDMFKFSQNVRTRISDFLAKNKGKELDDMHIQNMLMNIYNESIS